MYKGIKIGLLVLKLAHLRSAQSNHGTAQSQQPYLVSCSHYHCAISKLHKACKEKLISVVSPTAELDYVGYSLAPYRMLPWKKNKD